MTTVSRRVLFLVPVAFALPGCAITGKTLTDANVQKFIDNFTTISDAVVAIEPTLKTISGVSSGTVATVNTIIAGIKSAGTEVKSLVTTTAGLPLVQKLEDGVMDLARLLGGANLPGWAKTALHDAGIVMPLVKVAVGLLPLIPLAGDPAETQAAMARLRAAGATVRS